MTNLLPHAYPFVFIDRIVEYEKGRRIVSLKNVTIDEEILRSFSNYQAIPAYIVIEAMAQASGLLVSDPVPKMAYLSMIKDARFLKPVMPGDRLIIESSLVHKLPPFYLFQCRTFVSDEMVSEAEITLSLV